LCKRTRWRPASCTLKIIHLRIGVNKPKLGTSIKE
jgi:hypothetical protein